MKIREGRANVPDGLFAEEDSPARRHRYPGAARGASPYEGQAAGAGRAPQRGGASAPCDQGYHHHHHGDDHSDRVTYTIEMENGGREEEEARRMIDRVGGRAGCHHIWSYRRISIKDVWDMISIGPGIGALRAIRESIHRRQISFLVFWRFYLFCTQK